MEEGDKIRQHQAGIAAATGTTQQYVTTLRHVITGLVPVISLGTHVALNRDGGDKPGIDSGNAAAVAPGTAFIPAQPCLRWLMKTSHAPDQIAMGD
jgi:hypothetical protein